MRLYLTCLLVLTALGCRRLDPYYCESAPHHNCLAIDGPKGCTMDHDCTAPTAVCDVGGTMTCVQCTTMEHDACMATQPVCGDDHACRGCSIHAECPTSLACLPDGSCGTDANVAYVDPAGTDNDTCSHAMPCTKVAKALAAGKPFLKFQGATGTTDEAVTVKGGRQVTFLADPGAKLTRTQGNGAIVTVQDSSTSLSIYDLTITNAPNTPNGIGCLIPTGADASTLSLTRVKLMNNPGGGISTSGGAVTVTGSTISNNQNGGVTASMTVLTVTQSTISGNQGSGISTTSGSLTMNQSTISGNQGTGITTSGGTLTVSRSEVSVNTGGGIQMNMDGAVSLTSNILHHNGNSITASFGALSLRPAAGSTVQFNTIVDNSSNQGAASAGGVFCDVTGFVAADNLIFRNTGGTSLTTQTFGNCTYGNSFVAAGSSAVDNTPQFAHPNLPPLDYHLTSSTPTTIRDAAGACTGVDYDGDTRPFGPACDLGADEYHP